VVLLKEGHLKIGEDALQKVLETALDGYWLVNQQGRLVDVNQAACDMLGYPRQTMLSLHVADIDLYDSAALVKARSERVLRTGGDRFESRHRCRDGREIDVEVSISLLQVDGLFSVFIRDISERKRSQEELAESQYLLRRIIDTVPLRVFWKDHQLRYLGCNPAFAEDAGKSRPEEVVGKTDDQMVWAQQAALYRADDRAVMNSDQAKLFYEEKQTTASGQTIWLRTSKVPLKDSNNNTIGILGVYEDISDKKKYEAEQDRLKRALRLLTECSVVLLKSDDEEKLLSEICRLIVDVGGYLMAWIGFSLEDEAKTVQPVSQYGNEAGYLQNIRVSWDENQEIGLGPVGRAIRSGQPQVNQNYLLEPDLAPWREAAMKRGYRSSIGIPLSLAGKTIGALSVYAAEADAFGKDEVALLVEMVRNLMFGLESLRVRTQHLAAQAELAIAATAFNSQEGMVVTDANSVILRVNRAFTEITGYQEAEAVGQRPALLKSSRQNEAFYRAMWASLRQNGMWQGEVWNRKKNGTDYLAWLTISAVKSSEGTVINYVGTQFDITQRRDAEKRINELAFYDQLTGLPNRTLLGDRVRQAMKSSLRSGSYAALLIVDLDNFKTLNDTLGHDMGDVLLKQVAERLASCIRSADTVSRWGGDEFLVMLENLHPKQSDAAAEAEVTAEKMRLTLGLPYDLGDVPYHCTTSIGVTLFKGEDTVFDDLLKQSDMAMYRAKAAGRNAIRFFDPEMEANVKRRAALEDDLRTAVEEGQFLLHYQPQIVAGSGVSGAEVLVRWQHPRRGMVSPAEFIPMAEETDLILPLGQWVLETACRQLALWAGHPEMNRLTVAVNVSARQYRQVDFVDQVIGVLKKTGANPHLLKLELTESMLIDNVQDIIEKMFALKAKGVGFSLDDFGTGYSSLSYLKRLPLDQLKIDQSFVRDVLVDPNDAAIARTIVTLAQSLQLAVIAEGVETEEQRDFLAQAGCLAYQGYFFSRPLPVDGFEAFVRARSNSV